MIVGNLEDVSKCHPSLYIQSLKCEKHVTTKILRMHGRLVTTSRINNIF